MDLADRLNAIARGLEQLRGMKEALLLFGASEHRFVLGPVVDEEVVSRVEQSRGLRFPPDYRAFVMRLGDGGAGPFFGILPYGMYTDFHRVGDPAKPFPYVEAWQPSEADDDDDDDDDLPSIDGALPIAYEGGTSCDWLVVTGPEAGNVWHDGTADGGGLRPWASTTERMPMDVVKFRPSMIGGRASYATAPREAPCPRLKFLDWYECWLAHALAAVQS